MRDTLIGWIIAVSVLFLLNVTVLALSGWTIRPTAGEWLAIGLPTWIQAITTSLAAWAAWHLIKEWRPQKRAEAKAAQAPVIIGVLENLTSHMMMALRGGRSYEFPIRRDWLRQQLTDLRRERIEELKKVLMSTRQVLSSVVDDDVERELRAIYETGLNIRLAWEFLLIILEDGEEDVAVVATESDAAETEKSLQLLGFRKRREQNVMARQIMAQAKMLRERLRHHAAFRE